MGFLEPIAGIVAGSIGCVLVLLFWMLRLRRKPVRVSSTMLWKRSIRDLEGNIPWQRVKPSTLLFLQLLAVILLAIAIARPFTEGTDWSNTSGEVVVLIDAGASMQTMVNDSGDTRLDLAKDNAIDVVRSIGSRSSSARFRVFRVGPETRQMTSAPVSWRQARGAIESIQPSDVGSDLASAITLANLSVSDTQQSDSDDEPSEGTPQAVTLFAFTDSSIDDPAVRVIRPIEQLNEDWDAGNLGIVLVGAQRDVIDPAQCRVFVTVAGDIGDQGSVGVTIRARVDAEVLASQSVALEPDSNGEAEAAATLVLELDRSGIIELELSRPDVFMIDNSAWIHMPDPTPILTTVVARDGLADPLLVDVVRASTRGEVRVIAPEESVESATGLMIFDRVPRPERLLLPSIQIGSSESNESASIRRVLGWDRGHPLMQDVELGRLRYTIPDLDRPQAGSDVQVIARDESGPVIIETAQSGVRHIWIGFSIEDSNWGVQLSMPIFFANAVQRLLPGTSGSGVVYRTGIDAQQVGLTDGSDDPIGYSLLDRAETLRAGPVLDREATQSDGRDDPMGSMRDGIAGRVELWRWFVLAGLGVLILEWTLDLLRRRLI
ncbi:MAG: BatA domain-containing protein [Phycisphaerales bacterium]|nr:BatA domain-containing protein [Phycisphaerales bacterium]